MIDAKGAVLLRDGARLSVVEPGFVAPEHYKLYPGAGLHRSKGLWRLPHNVLGAPPQNGAGAVYRTPENGLTLRPYQRAGVDFLRAIPDGGLICYATGLGKTLVALHYFTTDQRAQHGVLLVCGPKKVAPVWVSPNGDPKVHYGLNIAQLESTDPEGFWPSLQTFQQERGTIHGVFVNYDVLHAWVDTINTRVRPSCIVFDEIHHLRNMRTRARRAAGKISKRRHVHKRIGCSATPVVNNVDDLWSQLDLVQPGSWGSWPSFVVRYAGGRQDEYGWQTSGETNVEELHHRLGGALLRVDQHSGGVELPALTRSRVPVLIEQLDQNVMAEYRKVMTTLRGGLIDQGQSLQGAELKALTQALQLLSQAKRQAALEQALDLCGTHWKSTIFCRYQATAKWLAKRLDKAGVITFGPITSSTSDKKRKQAAKALEETSIDALRDLDTSAAFVSTLGTSGEGINELRCCSGALTVDLWYVPMTMIQAEGRLHRLGRSGPVDWRYLVADETIDETLFAHLDRKAKAIATTLDDRDAVSLCETLGGRNELEDLKLLMAQLAEVPEDGEL